MREDIEFSSQGTACAAWLYRPTTTNTTSPCVVMAHGFSAVRDQALDRYAEHFAAAGIAVLLFDYRYFGASSGEPRQLLSAPRQLQDWQAAICCARIQPGIDPERIGLFGSSFSGGHVQKIAAIDPKVAAAVAQVPFCDGLKSLPALGLLHVMRLSLAGLRDVAGSLLGFAPYRIPAVGAPGTLAAMTTEDAVSGFAGMTPPNSNWRNEVCARFALTLANYRPATTAASIACPILYCVAEQDQLTPAPLACEAAQRAPQGVLKQYPCGHFDMYNGALWETVIAEQTAFLLKALQVPAA